MAVRPADAEFDEFVLASWPRLRWTAYLLVGDHHLAEDLTQTALVRTYAVWHKVRREDALAYTRKVLVNANIDRLRRRHLREVGGVEADDLRPADTGAEDRDQLVRLLATLTDRERKVVVLRHYYDLSEADVARELGVSVGTVKSTGSKALAKLRTRNGTDSMKGVS
jgi:RNA polymerase sigma-70 factor (sigma-E family)